MCTGSEVGNSSKPKCNKIRWIKIGKKRAWAEELLLWTSTKDRVKRWGKLIGAFVIRAYKNAHLNFDRNGVQVRDGPDKMVRNPEKQVMNLGQLMKSDTRISTPLNGSTSQIWHNVIKWRWHIIRVHRLLYPRHPKSRGHYRRSNDILFIPYPNLHKLSIGSLKWTERFE